MAGNRKKAEAELLRLIEAPQKGNGNVDLYKTYFKNMNDAQFDAFMKRLESGEETLTYIAPNFEKGAKLEPKKIVSMIRGIGVDPFQRIWMWDETTTPPTKYLTNDKYLILNLPIRRQNQLLTKKMSVATNNNVRDDLTGQPTGKISKTSSISFPEIQMLYGKGSELVLKEQLKVRGGDETAFRASNYFIFNEGSCTTKQIEALDTNVTSTEVLNILFKCMHLDSRL